MLSLVFPLPLPDFNQIYATVTTVSLILHELSEPRSVECSVSVSEHSALFRFRPSRRLAKSHSKDSMASTGIRNTFEIFRKKQFFIVVHSNYFNLIQSG